MTRSHLSSNLLFRRFAPPVFMENSKSFSMEFIRSEWPPGNQTKFSIGTRSMPSTVCLIVLALEKNSGTIEWKYYSNISMDFGFGSGYIIMGKLSLLENRNWSLQNLLRRLITNLFYNVVNLMKISWNYN